MESISYGPCNVCNRKRIKPDCWLCEGLGYYEHTPESQAVEALLRLDGSPVSEATKRILDARFHGITPDTFLSLLVGLAVVADGTFTELHNRGSLKWGMAWVHTNRFAVELAKLHGIDFTEHKCALSVLSWIWLENEEAIMMDLLDMPSVAVVT